MHIFCALKKIATNPLHAITAPVIPDPQEIPQVRMGKIALSPATKDKRTAAVVPFDLYVYMSTLAAEAFVFVSKTPLFLPEN